MERVIIHVDMDAFFAAVEQRDNPAYRGQPVIVGGTVEQRGVVSTASYEARKFGVHSAMSMYEAHRRCPNGIYLPVNMQKYRAVSQEIMAIFQQYTPEVEAISLDEAFLDVTGSCKLFGGAENIGRKIKAEIKEKLDLTASVGISYNKFLAKLASDLDKPDGFCVLTPTDLESRVWCLPIGKMMGVGNKTEQQLLKMQIKTIGQLAKMDLALLERFFGKAGRQMGEMARGIDLRPVEAVREHKSVGRETTFPQDIRQSALLESILFELTDDVCHTLRSQHLKGKTITLKIKYADFKTVTRAVSIDKYTANFEIVFTQIKQLLQQYYQEGNAVRLIGVTVSHLKPEKEIVEQTTLFTNKQQEEKQERLEAVLDSLNAKYGKAGVVRARKLEWE